MIKQPVETELFVCSALLLCYKVGLSATKLESRKLSAPSMAVNCTFGVFYERHFGLFPKAGRSSKALAKCIFTTDRYDNDRSALVTF